MKNFYSKQLLAVLLLLCSITTNAYDFAVDGIYYKVLSNSSVAVTYKGNSYSSYSNEYSGDITIPKKVTYNKRTYFVKEIEGSAFYDCTGITSITIPSSVTTIEDDAFYGCDSLKAVHISDLSAWCNIDFKYAKSNPLYYAKNLYLNGELVTDLVIPNDVTEIEDYAFYDCRGLTSITIPNSVTSIGSYAFYDCRGLTNIIIPNSVTEIETGAFCYCNGLTNITIGEGVTSIGYNVFYGCTGFTNITIPNSVKTIKNEAFAACHGLTSITIPNSVTTIEGNAFSGCTGLTSVTIGNSVTNIGEYAFSYCEGLTAVHISDLSAWCNIDFKYAESNPFYYAKNLYLNGELVTDLVIPNDVTEIEDYAFYDCRGLTSITIPNSVTSIGDYAFYRCDGLTSVTIGNGVTRIGNDAFESCISLTSITIPNSVTSIGDYAFEGCTGLASVTIGNGVTTIGDNAFYGCEKLVEIYNNSSLYITKGYTDYGYVAYYATAVIEKNDIIKGDFVFGMRPVYIYGQYDDTPIDTIFKPELIGYLGNDAEITLPANYEGQDYVIGNKAFYNYKGLENIIVESGNSVYDSREDCNAIIETETNTLIIGCKNTIIPNDVTEIENYAFYACDGLTSITIPNSVTNIGSNAFGNCYGLKIVYNNSSLNITKGSTDYGYVAYYANAVITGENANEYINIDDYLFHVTDSVNTLVAYTGNDSVITLPENCNDENYVIGDKAFYNCTGLTSITIPNSVTSIGNYAFYRCNGLTSITIPNSVTSIGNYAFYGCDSLKAVHISDLSAWCNIDFKYAKSNPLYYAKNLYLNGELVTDLVIPNDVTEIEQYAFYNCDGLTRVTIPNSVTSIGSYAFYDCDGLTSVTIPNSVTSIGGSAFYCCDSLKAVYITDLSAWCNIYFDNHNSNPLSYTGNLYLNGELVTDLVIPNDVTEIKQYAFGNCTSLTSITIPNSVTSIGRYVFSYCKNIESIILFKKLSLSNFFSISTIKHIYVTTEDLFNHYTTYYSKNVEYILSGECTATTLEIKNNISDVIEFSSINLEGYDEEIENMKFTGLEPSTNYKFQYTATTTDGEEISGTITATTDTLTFKTLPAKATSNTRTVICAEANIVNEETGVGFEWRRYDAPDLVPSNYAACAVNDSTIEGALNNLSANTYYKYRPYYCSAAGNYYYGEWSAFGTADAYVYFTPTVHTYEATVTASNAVRLYGYALAGSDDVIEQGFEYWADGPVTRSSGDVMTVTGSGQRMNVLLENLEYGTVYKYRTYVKTANETVYGEIQMFETSYPVGIEDVTAANEVSIGVHSGTIIVNGLNGNDSIQVYTLQGELVYNGHDNEIAVESGIYIVKVGDTVKKVLVK